MQKNSQSYRFIEVSHAITAGMQTYPGLPVPSVDIILDYETSREIYQHQAEFHIASLHLCGNTGTYVDAPYHRYRYGSDLASLSLDCLAHLPIVVVDVSQHPQRAIGAEFFQSLDLNNKALLIHTNWSRHWGTPHYFAAHPFLSKAACEWLVQSGVKFVGIDSLNIDDTNDPARPVHTLLLGAGIPICEHMTNLAAVPMHGCFLHAVPIAWVKGATFPVRAYVMQFENTTSVT